MQYVFYLTQEKEISKNSNLVERYKTLNLWLHFQAGLWSVKVVVGVVKY